MPNPVGIWLSRDKTQNIIIMDVEGSDSASRLDDQVGGFSLAALYDLSTVSTTEL